MPCGRLSPTVWRRIIRSMRETADNWLDEDLAADPDWAWVAAAERAAAALGRAGDDCRHHWRALAAASAPLAAGDPRRAAAALGEALALARAGEIAAAGGQLDVAATALAAADDWLAAVRRHPRARSSTFHFRLERRHAGTFAGPLQRRLAAQLAPLVGLPGDWRRALAGGGAAAIGSPLFADGVALRPGAFARLAVERGWAVDRPALLDDEGRLMAACLFAPRPQP